MRCVGYASKFWLFHFLYFSSVGITHFATASVVRVVMDFFVGQGASRLFIDFCFVLLKSGTRGGVVFAFCALGFIYTYFCEKPLKINKKFEN